MTNNTTLRAQDFTDKLLVVCDAGDKIKPTLMYEMFLVFLKYQLELDFIFASLKCYYLVSLALFYLLPFRVKPSGSIAKAFARAVYDFQVQGSANLCFNCGDIIEVQTMDKGIVL